MRLILLGIVALASARPDGFDQPCPPGEVCPSQIDPRCNPPGDHCPRKIDTSQPRNWTRWINPGGNWGSPWIPDLDLGDMSTWDFGSYCLSMFNSINYQ